MTAVADDGEVVGEDAYTQAREALRKVEEALERTGARLEQVVQTRMFLADAADWEAVGRAHGEVFGEIRPAAAMLVTGLLDPRMRVEIEAVAHVGADCSVRSPRPSGSEGFPTLKRRVRSMGRAPGRTYCDAHGPPPHLALPGLARLPLRRGRVAARHRVAARARASGWRSASASP